MFRTGSGPVSSGHTAPGLAQPLRKTGKREPPATRQSRGLEQFFFSIRDVIGLSVLDCAGANQENINFLIDLGHKVYNQDLVRGIDESFGQELAEQANVSRIDYFLRQNFDYPSSTFDGVLLWDSLQFMSPALLNATVDRLYDLMRPNSYLLAFFTAEERAVNVPSYTFRIGDNKTVVVTDRGMRPAGQVFNNRNLEKLFGKFESVKFFLTRENLREIIVRR
ncbi:MAG TPA: class I SAM-dependent methyltransferase [Bryobacteraceae bacterium]|jgi:hypothetical protein|nr:class I SAM-dependent methyltransferase [Bryobacteraceae bacterium]